MKAVRNRYRFLLLGLMAISALLVPVTTASARPAAGAAPATGATILDFSTEPCKGQAVPRPPQTGYCKPGTTIVNLLPPDGREVTVLLGTLGPSSPPGAAWVYWTRKVPGSGNVWSPWLQLGSGWGIRGISVTDYFNGWWTVGVTDANNASWCNKYNSDRWFGWYSENCSF
ncbi:hypothetical protein OG943_14585 [Amycolatopsis sp. NBC_00345]|uniref:hypothetical protein n=1 Tax=Amycolatopsis sp. NBC_00345 TaxID=2975955 RepID=UPI002E26FADE